MPDTTPALHFSSVLSDYTLSDAALAIAGVPTATQVQRRTHATATAITNPHVLWEIEPDPESTDELLTLNAKLHLVVSVGTETGQTTRTQAHAWLNALRSLFDEDHITTWVDFIGAQTEDYRDGWNIQAIYPGTITDDYDEAKALLTLTAPFSIVTFWNN